MSVKDYILDGWKFELIIDNKKFNISKQLQEKIDINYFLEIDNKFDFKKFISNNKFNKRKSFLKISNRKNSLWDPLTIKEFTPFKLYLGEINIKKKLEIVYFLNADLNDSFSKLLRDQLKDLLKSKIYNYSLIKLNLIFICTNIKRREKIRQIIDSILLDKYFNYEISFYGLDKNKEYRGINKVYQLSQVEDEKYILYFHGKGLSYISNKLFYIRQPLEKFIFKLLIHDWRKNLEKLYRLPSINKIGILSGGNGWLWFNFWIGKSSYLKQIEEPRKTKRAFYYEDWIARHKVINSKNIKKINLYRNKYDDLYYDSINQTLSILDNPKKDKYNIGSFCKVEKGGFVGLGIIKYTYRIWYLFYVVLNRIGLNKGDKDRFIFF